MKHVLLFAGLFMTLAVHAQKSSLTEYPGTYKLGRGDAAENSTVELKEDKLTISGRAGSAYLSMQKPDTFSVDEYGGEVIFLRNAAKQISGIKVIIPAASIDVEGTRVEELTEYVGAYKVGSGDDVDEVKVSLKDGILTVSGSKGSADLSRQQTDTFNVEQYGGQVIFKRTANKVSGIKIDIPAGNINIEGEKVDVNSAPAAYVQPAAYKKVTHTPFVKQGQTDLEAHQGGCGLMPCNTMLSFMNAVKLDVNTLEMDCVISRDSLVVLSHDQFMDFTMRSPDGKDNITALGITLIPWTIDARADLQRILSLGVDGIITNYPDVAKRLINGKK